MRRRDFLVTTAARLAAVVGVGRAAMVWPQGLPFAAAWQAQPVLGLNVHVLTEEYIRHVQALGVRHVRTTLLWPLWAENALAYRLAWKELIDRTTDAGLQLLVVAHNWPADRPVVPSKIDRGMMDRFADFIANQARLYPQVEGWQLWNEPDMWVQAPFGAGAKESMPRRGEAYATQLRLAYPRIKDANRRALVVSAGTADHPSSGFLEGMMEHEPPCDAVAIHAYGDWAAVRERLTAARRIVHGRPLWVTECGSGSHRAAAAAQAADWESTIRGNEAENLAQRVYPYALFTTEPGHTLLNRDGSARPAYRWLQTHLRRTQRPRPQ